MKRAKYNRNKIFNEVKLPSPYDKLYDDKDIKIIGNAVLDSLVEIMVNGGTIDYGLGNQILRLRKYNNVLGESKNKYTVVCRGDLNKDIRERVLDLCESNPDLYDLYGKADKDMEE